MKGRVSAHGPLLSRDVTRSNAAAARRERRGGRQSPVCPRYKDLIVVVFCNCARLSRRGQMKGSVYIPEENILQGLNYLKYSVWS